MYLVKLLLLSFHTLNILAKEEEEDPDIKGIKINKKDPKHWKLELDLGNGTIESVALSKRPSILNKNIKIDECKKAGDCQQMEVGDSEEKCNFGGSFDSDPDSIVNIFGCDDENQDFVLVSSKKKFKGTTYRKNAKTGKVTSSKLIQNTTVPISLEKEKQLINSTNNKKGEKCCNVKKARCKTVKKEIKTSNICHIYYETVCGQICQETSLQKANDYEETMVKVKGEDFETKDGNHDDRDNCCVTIKTVCSPTSENYGYVTNVTGQVSLVLLEPETEETCKTVLGDSILCGSVCDKAEYEDKKNEDTTSPEPNTSQELNASQEPNTSQEPSTTKEPDTIEEANTTEEPSTTKKLNATAESVNPDNKNKYIKDAKQKDLERVEKKYKNKDDKPKKNGSEKNNYKKKTLEFGVTLDPEVYEDAKKKLGADQNKIRKQLMKNIQHTLLTAQSFLQHKSISKTGGFSIIVNGIKIVKDWGAETKLAKEQKSLLAALEVWEEYVEKNNNRSDDDEFYHDINLLFTGKKHGEIISEYSYKGFACVNCICKKNAHLIFTFPLTKTSESPEGLGRLLAHEIGHILGASHDNGSPAQYSSIFKDKSKVPCPPGFLMSASVRPDYEEFSSCSQSDIDNDPNNKKQTCLFK